MNNDKFYNWLKVEDLESFAKKTFGENPPSDLEQVLKYLKSESSVLEIGAGTGRIGIHLIKEGFDYTSVEKQKKYLEVFESRLNNIEYDKKRVNLINCSYEDLPLDKRYGVIIFSWTVIGDFDKENQINIIKKTYNHLSKDGICIIDNPSMNQPYNEFGSYNPTPFYYEEWKDNLIKIGFKHSSKLYKTKTGVERELTILKKQIN